MFKGIGHMAFVVSDMDKSLHYYRDLLGFEFIKQLNDENDKPWLVYLRVKNGQYIELFYNGSRRFRPNDTTACYSHMCIETKDIYRTAAHLAENNVLINQPSQGKDYNYQCWSSDPDGNMIEFMMIDPRSPQANS